MMNYDVLIIGAGPGGIYSAYELTQRKPELKVAVFASLALTLLTLLRILISFQM